MSASPDGEALLARNGAGDRLQVVGIKRPAPPLIFDEPARMEGFDGQPSPLAWSRDRRSIWSVTQPWRRPGGGFTGPLRPIRFDEGVLHDLPALDLPGRLDTLVWIGRHGLALAGLDYRGDYYRPEQPNPDATFAIVDAGTGAVRDLLRWTSVPRLAGFSLSDQASLRPPFIHHVAATVLPDGRARVLLDLGFWMVWTEGSAPRFLPGVRPQPASVPAVRRMTIRMTPEGRHVLIDYGLSRSFGTPLAPGGRSFVGPPFEGTQFALLDLESGDAVWEHRGQIDGFNSSRVLPVISPDGRHAVVAMPRDAKDGFADRFHKLGLVALDAGVIQQIFPIQTGSAPDPVGFTPDGRMLWLRSDMGVLATYDLAV